MARPKAKPKMVEVEKTSQARIELPADDMERVRKASRKRGMSLSAFIRMAVLKETGRVEEGRDL